MTSLFYNTYMRDYLPPLIIIVLNQILLLIIHYAV